MDEMYGYLANHARASVSRWRPVEIDLHLHAAQTAKFLQVLHQLQFVIQ